MRRAILLASLIGMTGCVTAIGPGPSAGGTLQSGRQITAQSDHWYRTILCRPISAESEVIRVGRHQVVVEPAQITVDGDVVASIPVATSEVTVAESKGELQVVADGEMIYSAAF